MFEKVKKGRERKCHLRPLGGTGGTKNIFTFLSALSRDVDLAAAGSLGLSLHHRSGLYNYAFINTSFAMCSLPSRWLTEGYRGH